MRAKYTMLIVVITMVRRIDASIQDLVSEKIRTQQLTDEVERMNREMELRMAKSTGTGIAQSEK